MGESVLLYTFLIELHDMNAIRKLFLSIDRARVYYRQEYLCIHGDTCAKLVTGHV